MGLSIHHIQMGAGEEGTGAYVPLSYYLNNAHNSNVVRNAHYTNGPLACNVKYFNNMQIARDVTTGSLPNVWRPLEKALIISLHWFTEPFILFVRMQ